MGTEYENHSADPSILVCDDSIEEIRVLVSMLKRANYRLSISSNGRDACLRASVTKPDLILMDVRMPMMDGFAACRILKANEETRNIPLIFLTCANDPEDRIEGLKLGAVDYIIKPVIEEEVLLRVGIHLNKNSSNEQKVTYTRQSPRGARATLVQATCQLLDRDIGVNLSIDEIAERVGTHRHRLTEAFKEAFGTTVFGWLRERRMLIAANWLKTGNMSIDAISQELGFVSPGNFSTAFKGRYGVTPREYRRSMSEPPSSLPFTTPRVNIEQSK